ncbi:carbohydrate binding family 9 domain-containing protein [Alteromonas sp. a30]|uniref:carbohydrate binding family 9 domain-containing protein n=1 Tax=Alteromonas sp. a30 TaxID=2730917 RepID=UPI0022831354|nr:DUF5916 domain-containing protein [Alteromonas sp. a30]MCY7293954.1 carbohydrate binding family 9 domain-containing protein [Alteromonas sp. a30]
MFPQSIFRSDSGLPVLRTVMQYLKKITGIFGLLMLWLPLQSYALNIPKFDTEIKVDGDLSDPAWQHANTLTLHNITQPYENLPAPVETNVKFFENSNTLFIAFIAHDPNPEEIRSFYHQRDDASRDDLVGVRLDPYGDHRLVFQFFTNPFGVQVDSIEDVLALETSDSWDGIWDSAGKVTDSGYQVEIAIPLRNFNFNNQTEIQSWAMEFVRIYPRKERYRLSHIEINRDNECIACQMASVSGFENIEHGKSLALTPTLVYDHTKTRNVITESDWNSNNNYELGLDIKWGINSDVFLNATINPDFSQIEADDAQISINDNFTLTLEEKRPFFLENQDLFSTSYNLVYTRNISSPNFGAKVTGRSGKHAYGVFLTDDDSTTFFVPGNLGSSIARLESTSKNAAVRYRYDANKDLNIGFLGTFRDADNYHNYVGATDIRYKVTDQDIINAQFIGSDTQYPEDLSDQFCFGDDCYDENLQCEFANCNIDESFLRTNIDDNFSGHALRIVYTHDERHWFSNLRYQEISSGFRSDLGNQIRVDQSRTFIQLGLNFWGDSDNWWNKISVWSDWDILHNDDREVLEREWEWDILVQGALQSYIFFRYLKRDEVGSRLDDSKLYLRGNTTMFDIGQYELESHFQPTAGLLIGLDAFLGDKIDFTNNREGQEYRFIPYFEYSFNKHFSTRLSFDSNRLKAEGEEVFRAHVADFRFDYNLDLRQSLKLSLIYTDIEFNPFNQPALLPENLPYIDSTDIASQLIYSYKINPQTVFFAGYSDHSFRNDDVEDLKRDSYKIFFKFSYAWLQ